MNSFFEHMKDKAIQSKDLTLEEIIELYRVSQERPFMLFGYASEIREHYKGKRISLCGIINAKSGICPENCQFCAQSAHYSTGAPVYPLVSAEEIIEKAKEARADGAQYFSIVTSGTTVSTMEEWSIIYRATEGILNLGLRPCASLGIITEENAVDMKNSGLYRYHHNLETARSNFDNICSTHDYDDDVQTVRLAKKAGLSVCSGGIIGLGESMEQRIEMAFTLKELDVDSVPINILNAIPGTPLADTAPLQPLEILLTVSLYRFVLPDKDIKLCGGKEKNLRQLLPLGIIAGCNSLMTGNYLTTLGRESKHDMEMIADLGCILSPE